MHISVFVETFALPLICAHASSDMMVAMYGFNVVSTGNAIFNFPLEAVALNGVLGKKTGRVQ